MLSDSFEVSTSNFDLFSPGDFYHSAKRATIQPNHSRVCKVFLSMHEEAEQNARLRSRRSSTTSTAESTTELRSKLSRWCTLLAVTSITSAVTSFAVTSISVATTAATSTERLALALALPTHHATRRSVRSLLLDMRCGDNFSGKMEPFAEIVKTLRSESVVVVLPRELSLDVAAGGERLAGLDDEEILSVNVVVLWEVVILLCNEHTLTEEVLVDLLSVCLGNKPGNDQQFLSSSATYFLTSWRLVAGTLLRPGTRWKFAS